MKKLFVFCFALLFLNSCTVYTEKQSEALSKSVYATKDSLNAARLDLADQYSTEAIRIVKPPKKRIPIESVYKKTINVETSDPKPTVNPERVKVSKNRVLVVPDKYKNDTVIVINSEEYSQLMKDKEVYKQIEQDNRNLIETKKAVDEELTRQMEYREKMIKDLNIMQKKLVEKDLAILQRNIVIIFLLGIIVGATYLRIKGIL